MIAVSQRDTLRGVGTLALSVNLDEAVQGPTGLSVTDVQSAVELRLRQNQIRRWMSRHSVVPSDHGGHSRTVGS